MNTMKKLISILLCMTFILTLFACCKDGNDTQSTPEETPVVTPGESTPAESTPGESTPEASTPGESTPAESPPAPFQPEVATSVPEITETEPLFRYKKLPDAFAELTVETRSKIEAAVGQSVNWDKHYLGIHRGFIIFGTYDPDNAKHYRRGEMCFGYITDLYGYRDGTLYSYRSLRDSEILNYEYNYYISYIGLKKEIGELPDSGKEVSNEAKAEIIEKCRWYQNNYFGEYNGYYIFGDGSDIDMYPYYLNTENQDYAIHGQDRVCVYYGDKGVLDLNTAYAQDLIDIEYLDIVRAVFISQLIYYTRYVFPAESLPA